MNRTRLNLLLAVGLALAATFALWERRHGPPPAPALPGPAAAQVTGIRIENRHGQAHLERHGEDWRLAGQPPLPAARGRVDDLLSLARARIERQYPADQGDPKALGFAPPRATVTWEPSGFRVEIGGTEPVEGLRYVRLGDRIALIPDYLAQPALEDPVELVSHRLLPRGADPVEIQTPKVHLQRGKDGRWSLVGAAGRTVSRDRINTYLDDWRYARALGVERLAGKPPKGLPVWRVRLADGRTLRFLLQDEPARPTRLLRTDLHLAYEITTHLRDQLVALPPAPAQGKAGADGHAGKAGTNPPTAPPESR
ncbi:MAG: DUF4340 domain-containing protein [Gammaproteobacteria bacterium]|nr:MAG: DUF4340 domain-containing protein [Gammaproteobacteria bacterium]